MLLNHQNSTVPPKDWLTQTVDYCKHLQFSPTKITEPLYYHFQAFWSEDNPNTSRNLSRLLHSAEDSILQSLSLCYPPCNCPRHQRILCQPSAHAEMFLRCRRDNSNALQPGEHGGLGLPAALPPACLPGTGSSVPGGRQAVRPHVCSWCGTGHQCPSPGLAHNTHTAVLLQPQDLCSVGKGQLSQASLRWQQQSAPRV